MLQETLASVSSIATRFVFEDLTSTFTRHRDRIGHDPVDGSPMLWRLDLYKLLTSLLGHVDPAPALRQFVFRESAASAHVQDDSEHSHRVAWECFLDSVDYHLLYHRLLETDW